MIKPLQGKLWTPEVYADKVYFYNSIEKYLEDSGLPPETMRSTLGMTLRMTHGRTLVYLLGVFDHCDSTLVHECGHLGVFICKSRHISTVTNAGEAFCYLIDAAYRAGKKAGLLKKRKVK